MENPVEFMTSFMKEHFDAYAQRASALKESIKNELQNIENEIDAKYLECKTSFKADLFKL